MTRNDSEQEKMKEISANTDYIKLRDKITLHLSFQRSLLGFHGIPGSNGVPVRPGRYGGRKDHRKGKVQRETLVINNYKECRVKGETEDAKGLPGGVDFVISLCVSVWMCGSIT